MLCEPLRLTGGAKLCDPLLKICGALNAPQHNTLEFSQVMKQRNEWDEYLRAQDDYWARRSAESDLMCIGLLLVVMSIFPIVYISTYGFNFGPRSEQVEITEPKL